MARTRQQNEAGVHERPGSPLSLTNIGWPATDDLALRQADAVRADFYPISVELTRPPSRKGGLCRARYCRAGVRAL